MSNRQLPDSFNFNRNQPISSVTKLIYVKFLEQRLLSKKIYLAMGGYRGLAFLLFQGMINVSYLAAEEDAASSRSTYFMTRENQQLVGHVVEQLESTSSLSCSYYCLRNRWCTSTNFKLTSEKNDKGTCELNKHGILDENTEFHEQDGVTFSLMLKVTQY